MPRVTERPRDLPGDLDLLVAGSEREGTDARTPGWVWRLAGLVARGLVVVLAGPGRLSRRDQRPQPAADVQPSTPPPAGVVGPNVEHVIPPLRWEPRGSQVRSAFAIAAVARLSALRQGVDTLLWAGTLDGHDHVAVISYRRQ